MCDWSKKENDLVIAFPKRSDGNFLHSSFFDSGFIKELIARGYDIKTLKFSIKKPEVQGE